MIDGPTECVADRGREAVYAAEEAAFGGTAHADPRTLAHLQSLSRSVVDGDWWRHTGAPAVAVVAARRSARSSSARVTGSHTVIRLATGQLDEATLAHEIAHVLAGVGRGHDERFRAAHVDVVRLLAGSAAASMLTEAYADFDLSVGQRGWPPPSGAAGESFLIVP